MKTAAYFLPGLNEKTTRFRCRLWKLGRQLVCYNRCAAVSSSRLHIFSDGRRTSGSGSAW